MPKKQPKFTKDLHILVTEEQYNFLKNQGDMGRYVRRMIDSCMGKHDLAKIEKRIAEIEPEYFLLKKRRDEMIEG